MTALPDLRGRADLERLLTDFYARAFADPLLGHVFVDVAQLDLESHLPRITDFWEKVLFDRGTYAGAVMAVHRRLHQQVPLTAAHFDRWLELWQQALDGGFTGPVAAQASAHAARMAAAFLHNLTAPPRSLSLTVT